jgi:hypothetical protein
VVGGTVARGRGAAVGAGGTVVAAAVRVVGTLVAVEVSNRAGAYVLPHPAMASRRHMPMRRTGKEYHGF